MYRKDGQTIANELEQAEEGTEQLTLKPSSFSKNILKQMKAIKEINNKTSGFLKVETEPNNLTSNLEKALLYRSCKQGNFKAVLNWMNDHEHEELPTDDGLGRYPIHYAAENGHAAIVDYLASQLGYNVCQKTVFSLFTEVPEEKTALHFAVENNHLKVVQVLLKHGADVLESDQNQKTPIEIAKEKGYLELLKLLQHHHSEKG